jgi:starch phosphorylase
LALPVAGIGFMYPEGYVSQRMREDGWQEDLSQPLERDAASINAIWDSNNRPLVVRIPLIEPPIFVAVWKIDVGRVTLYLMDTDFDLNDPWNRKISAKLYVGDPEQRLRQEIVLGLGGSELIETMGLRCKAVHLNEGHAAFVQLERMRDKVQAGVTFAQALEQVRTHTVFTTHTPVAAGHDIFPFYLMEKYFKNYWPSLTLDHDSFLSLGVHPAQPGAGFNMTALALRTSAHSNAVSKRHGEVSRAMWQSLWPDRTTDQVPIGHITNGVHVPTWIEPKLMLLFNQYLGMDWIERHDDPRTWQAVDLIPDEILWQTHQWLKIKLIHYIREAARQRWSTIQYGRHHVLAGGAFLDPTVLTIGFARRFTSYKRADLLLWDMQRLRGLLNNLQQPLQIIFAGKAHPMDSDGKRILQRVYAACLDPLNGGRLAYVENYGEQIAQYMVHGADLWLNNPLPPYEACGTSGMKAALNGVPQISIADGWWLEGFDGTNGWIFGEREDGKDRNADDARSLYDIIADRILPLYNEISEKGIPHKWVRIMKSAMKSCGAQFSARRMIKAYQDQYYRQICD